MQVGSDRPPLGWFKLNVDGYARGDENVGGGIIRNSEGAMVAAFSYYYGAGSNNLAEFLALKDGILLCKVLNISSVLIESHSSIAVTVVRSAQGDNWKLAYVLRECIGLYTPTLNSFMVTVRRMWSRTSSLRTLIPIGVDTSFFARKIFL